MPSKVIILVIEFMFLGINIFWALLRAHFNPRLTDRAKMNLRRAQNIFMPANINSVVLLIWTECVLLLFDQVLGSPVNNSGHVSTLMTISRKQKHILC